MRKSLSKAARMISRKHAPNVTTGSKSVPSPVKSFNNKHSRVILYDNGGTTTINKRDGLVTNRTPQARSKGGQAASYRLINERNQAYIGYTAKGSFSSGRHVANGPRVKAHMSGRGAAVTKQDSRLHVDVVNIHATKNQAMKSEKKFYLSTKEAFGKSTRGAGNTTRRYKKT